MSFALLVILFVVLIASVLIEGLSLLLIKRLSKGGTPPKHPMNHGLPLYLALVVCITVIVTAIIITISRFWNA